MQVDLSINTDKVTEILTEFISDSIKEASAAKGIVGLSGGLDSSVVAALSAKALGNDRVLGVIMPYRTSSPQSREDAEQLAKSLGIETEMVDITPMVDAFYAKYQEADANRRGNFMARQRMTVLYDISARERALVIGTSNRSEILLGYGTVYGDLACAVNPVGGLYKTQMRQLAEALGIPETIRLKKPSADLEIGQTDEGDFGFTYAEADKLLYLKIDRQLSDRELEDKGFDSGFIASINERIEKNRFKSRMPKIAILT